MASMFLSTRSVCSAMPPEVTFPVAGSMATFPETNTIPAALMACEYGPIACGASLVAITSREFGIESFYHRDTEFAAVSLTRDERAARRPRRECGAGWR